VTLSEAPDEDFGPALPKMLWTIRQIGWKRTPVGTPGAPRKDDLGFGGYRNQERWNWRLAIASRLVRGCRTCCTAVCKNMAWRADRRRPDWRRGYRGGLPFCGSSWR